MQTNLLTQLCQALTFSPKLTHILQSIHKSISSFTSTHHKQKHWHPNTIKQIQHHLISLTCQNKNLLHYKYLEDKNNNERCIAYIIQILSMTAKIYKQSKDNIVCLFLSHILSHTSCYVSYYTFYILLENVPEMIQQISFQSLFQINSKIKRQQNGQNFKVLQSIRISQNQAFTPQNIQHCQRNLDNFLRTQFTPSYINRDKQKNDKLAQTKIPPLLLPTSKSINSSRYSAISRQQKRKGLADLQKLASNLGQGFITVQLGCLLANKRTRQVQQFSQNQQYRQKCLQKLDRIETQRMNSSRLTMYKQNINQNNEGEQKAKKYYRKVLTINSNICLKKQKQKFKLMEWINKKIQLTKKKTQNNNNPTYSQYLILFIQQIFDMSIVGLINLSLNERTRSTKTTKLLHHHNNNPTDIFSTLLHNLKPINQVLNCLIQKVSIQSQKLHLNLLLNRNKSQSNTNCNTRYSLQTRQYQINDQFLGDIHININQPQRVQGSYKQSKKIHIIKKYSQPILLYLGSWLQSLQQLADMSHPMFYFYQTNILKGIAYYLTKNQNKVSNYYCTQYLFYLIIMVKRQIVQLSHPYIGSIDIFKTSQTRLPLSHRYPNLFQHFLLIITALLQGTSRHVQRLLSNIFIKNIYFMETVQNYFQHMVKQQNISAIIHTLQFYKKCLQIYTNSIRKNQSSSTTHKNTQNTPTYYLFQHIAQYLCPRNGCIAKILLKYQNFISPSNLDKYDEQQNNTEQNNKFMVQNSTSLLNYNKNSQTSIQSYLHQIFLFINQVYYLACPSNNDSLPILQQDICSYYIKYAVMNFIKLYSLLTVNQLANINDINSKINQLDYVPSTKQSPHGASTTKINTKQIYMIDFLKILTSISINRTPDIAKKFRQYRVLQFFVREIQLEFSVIQNIEKYIKKAVNIRSVKQVLDKFKQKQLITKKNDKIVSEQNNTKKTGSKKQTQVKQTKKMTVPGLNLTGQIFKKQIMQQHKPKEIPNQKPKKMIVPSLNLPSSITQQSHESKQKNKKGFLDDMIQQIVISKNPKKKSFKQQLNLNLKLDSLNINKDKDKSLKSKQLKSSSDSSMIYSTQRKIRKIYSNKVLHAQSILLILSLILYKGQLDPIYCDQMPIIHGKLNVLYILHYHINHQRNKSIINILTQYVAKIKPSLSGQRLFKLLSNNFTDLSHYYDWTKINAGAFGVIMSAKTNMIQPKQVAIKQMNFPKSIYQRCVLNDIFTEITSLEMFRLQNRVTRMYNYGVIDNTYVIIMKKYACSLRDWRLGNTQCPQAKLFPPTLPNILALFYEVIKGLKLLHEQNVTHYDIKGDNILLQFLTSSDPRQPPKVNIVFADFGVAKIYSDEKDELDLKSRGTECIKSPQMLTLALKNKKQADNYDRRKKIGTTKASDIWSLGCLLYEIVTGEFLFNSNDWVHFFMQVTSQNQQILSINNCQKMKNNVYLIDFMKFILIRDPQHRPSIHSILSRFQNLYALLVTNPQRVASTNLRQLNNKTLEQLVKDFYNYIQKQQHHQQSRLVLKSTQSYPKSLQNKRLKSQSQFGRTRKVMQIFNSKISSKLIKIMQDIYFCQREQHIIQYQQSIRKQGITHIILQSKTKINKNKFKVVELQCVNYTINQCYRLSPRISDVLREVLLMKGKLLFVNGQTNFCVNLLIYTLCYWFKCSVYETWCLINTQILQFPAFNSNIISMSQAAQMLSKIEQEVYEMPKLQCICGSVTIILKKKFQQKRGDFRICKCKKNKNQNNGCFSKNCLNYLQLIQKRYNIVWDHLTFTLVNNSQLLTPIFNADYQQVIQTQIMLNSADPFRNMITDSKNSDQWKIYQCKTCEMWMLATNGKQIWLILNNLIKSSRQGIMIPNAQQDFKARTPTLNHYTLSKLHMTTQ